MIPTSHKHGLTNGPRFSHTNISQRRAGGGLARPQYANKLPVFTGRTRNGAHGIIRRLRFGTRVAPETKPQAHGTPFASQSDVGGPRAVPVKNSRPVEWVARQQISSGARAPPQNFTNSRSQLPVPSETQLMRPGALPPYSPKVEARDDRYLQHSSILI